jgi:hypothetical protein
VDLYKSNAEDGFAAMGTRQISTLVANDVESPDGVVASLATPVSAMVLTAESIIVTQAWAKRAKTRQVNLALFFIEVINLLNGSD